MDDLEEIAVEKEKLEEELVDTRHKLNNAEDELAAEI